MLTATAWRAGSTPGGSRSWARSGRAAPPRSAGTSTAATGGGREHPLYNSCRNRHCPTCQGLSAIRWSEARAADILPVPYFHAVFTLPSEIAAIAFCNRRVVFDIMFRTVAETLRTIAEDPRHGGLRIGGTAVLHTWD